MGVVLITGASSGIGQAFAETLAAQGRDLLLVARSEDKLAATAGRLHATHGVTVHTLALDLAVPGASGAVTRFVEQQHLTVDWLINNAGFGEYGAVATQDPARLTAMVNLNITTLMELTCQYLPAMRDRRAGVILNVASIAGFQPMPYLAVYAATKAFVLSFSEALWAENRAFGVEVLALCPGPTETAFFTEARMPYPGWSVPASHVVADALAAVSQRRAHVVTGGWRNQVIVNLARWLPRERLVRLVESQFRPPAAAPSGDYHAE